MDADIHNRSPASSVLRLSLGDFRNWESLRLDIALDAGDALPSVVITGTNGSGKTSILEALSLLVPGRGLRRAAVADMQRIGSVNPWTVFAVVNTTRDVHVRIGTGRASSAIVGNNEGEGERRVVHINGIRSKGQQALAEYMTMAWIVPEMDRVLAEGAASRRKLLDRLVSGFDPAHLGRVQRYDKAMRERLRLLRDGRGGTDGLWLSSLEDIMATSATAIAAGRQHMLDVLTQAMMEVDAHFPHATLGLVGMAEKALSTLPALAVEDKLRAALQQARRIDTAAGTCSVGAHRSDMIVVHAAKGCSADLCSTGEQKALMVAIMLAYVRAVTTARGIVPILLLDDVAAHLDDLRRHALYDEIRAIGTQAWLTGTDEELFSGLLPYAQHVVTEDLL